MISIFISNAKEDTECAEQIRTGLESKGYTTWHEPPMLTMESILYPHTIESAILGGAVFILVWSSNAAHSEWVKRHILFAQNLRKTLIPILLDGMSLPNTLISVSPITCRIPCSTIVTQLVPLLPPPDSVDPLIKLSGKAAHEYIRERKEAIDQAAEMLKRDEQRESVLAVLEYLARNDTMTGVREKAQEVLDADSKKVTPPRLSPSESRHIFGIRCCNGHITYFDKRHVCSVKKDRFRAIKQRAGKDLDELRLTCEHCGVDVTVYIDCEGYR